MYNGLGHIAIRVSDMKRALKFYCSGMGLKQKFSLKDAEEKPWIEYLEIVPGSFIELFYDNKNQIPQKLDPDRLSYLHACIETPDIKNCERQLKENGILTDGPIKMQSDKSWQLWVTDPDGNRIEIMEYTKESLQVQK
ncbi:lactoylglutathione lyase [uncultured Clostridium sp.]|uniref:VOC family protein n=1 Tax=Clostridia TaxID=186801 RepID=UPI0005D3B9AB|nr:MULTISPECIES: VOC family protein [Clostridia]KJJ71419.1 glyoxalase-like domain protein [Clostridium sp. FS41]SCH25126.1 lactoylglutathione lyase [uncultured Clostridium sp.]